LNKNKVIDNWTRINNHHVHYVTAGKGLPLLLFHGGGNDWKEWLNNIESLSNSYQVIAPDCIGFGQTDRHDNHYYTIDEFIDFTEAFITSLQLESVNIVGHSLGGRVILEYAYRHPEKVNHLIAVTPFGMGKVSRKGYVVAWLAYWTRRFILRRQPYPKMNIDFSDTEVMKFSGKLKNINVPVLIMWGHKDKYLPIEHGRKMQELIHDSKLEVLDCGHAPQHEKSKQFNETVISFINGKY